MDKKTESKLHPEFGQRLGRWEPQLVSSLRSLTRSRTLQ